MTRGLPYNLEVRDGGPAHAGGHQGRIVRVSSHRRVYGPRLRQPLPHDDCPITASNLSPGHHLYKPRVRRLSLRDDHKPRGIPVEAVHDPGPVRVLTTGNSSP